MTKTTIDGLGMESLNPIIFYFVCKDCFCSAIMVLSFLSAPLPVWIFLCQFSNYYQGSFWIPYYLTQMQQTHIYTFLGPKEVGPAASLKVTSCTFVQFKSSASHFHRRRWCTIIASMATQTTARITNQQE